MLRRRCRQVAGKARLRWVLWPGALTDYYYCYCPQEGGLSVRVALGLPDRWPAEVGTGAGGVLGSGGRGGGWGWGRAGSWWWGRWEERGALDLLRRSVSSGRGRKQHHLTGFPEPVGFSNVKRRAVCFSFKFSNLYYFLCLKI